MVSILKEKSSNEDKKTFFWRKNFHKFNYECYVSEKQMFHVRKKRCSGFTRKMLHAE